MTKTDEYLARMGACARAMGRELALISERHHATRLHELDATSVELGFDSGLLSIEQPNRVRTADPFQGTAWLVEGNPARLCWEYLPHMAAYVELIENHRYPPAAIRFETPDSEMNLDLAVLDAAGRVLVLGEVKREAPQITNLERQIQEFGGDPGRPSSRGNVGAPAGPRREAWKLAHQLWQTRAPYLLLVTAGVRRSFDVDYSDRLRLHARADLPAASELWPVGFNTSTPRIVSATDADYA